MGWAAGRPVAANPPTEGSAPSACHLCCELRGRAAGCPQPPKLVVFSRRGGLALLRADSQAQPLRAGSPSESRAKAGWLMRLSVKVARCMPVSAGRVPGQGWLPNHLRCVSPPTPAPATRGRLRGDVWSGRRFRPAGGGPAGLRAGGSGSGGGWEQGFGRRARDRVGPGWGGVRRRRVWLGWVGLGCTVGFHWARGWEESTPRIVGMQASR